MTSGGSSRGNGVGGGNVMCRGVSGDGRGTIVSVESSVSWWSSGKGKGDGDIERRDCRGESDGSTSVEGSTVRLIIERRDG